MWTRRWRIVAGFLLLMSLSALADEADDAIERLKALDPVERQVAVAELSYGTPSQKILDALMEAATTDPDPTVAAAAVDAVGTLGQSAQSKKAYVDALVGLLAKKDLALNAAVALEPLAEKTSQAQRLALYRESLDDPELRPMALMGLTRNTGSESFALLTKLIEPAPVEEQALLALYMKPGTQGEDVCAVRLAKGLQAGEGEDFDICLAFANRIAEKKDGLVPVLEQLVGSLPDLGKRFDVALTLYRWEPGRRRLQAVLQLLESPEGLTAENLNKVTSNLQQADYRHIRAPLAKAFPTITDEEILSVMIDALAVPGAGEEETMTGLLSFKGHSSPVIRAKVAKNSTELGVASARSVTALKELMKDPELEVAVIAATSYYKLTFDKAPVVEVFRRAAKSEVGAEILYNNVDAEVAYPLSEDLFDILLPLVKAGDSTAKQVMPPLLDHLRLERLAEVLEIYPELDPDSRTIYLSSLSSVHISRPGLRAFLERLTTSKEPDEAYSAAQLLYQKAGDSTSMIKLARQGLTSGKRDQILQAVNYVAYEAELANQLLAEMEAALAVLSDADDRSSVITGLLQTDGREVGIKHLLAALRSGDHSLLSGFFYDTELAVELAKHLEKADKQALASFLAGYSKDPRSWEADLNQAVFCCLLLSQAEGGATLAADTLRYLAASHSSELLRMSAAAAVEATDEP